MSCIVCSALEPYGCEFCPRELPPPIIDRDPGDETQKLNWLDMRMQSGAFSLALRPPPIIDRDPGDETAPSHGLRRFADGSLPIPRPVSRSWRFAYTFEDAPAVVFYRDAIGSDSFLDAAALAESLREDGERLLNVVELGT